MEHSDLIPPFESCNIDAPYIFASYAHKDSALVFPELSYLHQQGYRIWYDEGIDPGNEWPEDIAKSLLSCSYFIVYISSNSVKSKNVRNEINLALNNNKPFLAIYIKETTLPPGLQLRMGDIQAVFKWRMTEESYKRKIAKTLTAVMKTSQTAPNDKSQLSGSQITPDISEIACVMHEYYRMRIRKEGWRGGRYDIAYDDLPDEVKQNNHAAAARMLKVLGVIGLSVVPGNSSNAKMGKDIKEIIGSNIELLAEAEHNDWMYHKLQSGWKYSEERNDEKKVHDDLRSYFQLDEKQKEKDRTIVRQHAEILLFGNYGLASPNRN